MTAVVNLTPTINTVRSCGNIIVLCYANNTNFVRITARNESDNFGDHTFERDGDREAVLGSVEVIVTSVAVSKVNPLLTNFNVSVFEDNTGVTSIGCEDVHSFQSIKLQKNCKITF